jgi:DNA repair protein RecO (recombination protein O)
VSQERTEAIVLRGVDFGETSRIVTFFSPERGRLTCIAQGARRPKNRYGAALDTLNRLELVYYWKDGREVQKLGEVSLLEDFGQLKADLDKSLFTMLPVELVYRIAHANEPSSELYGMLMHGLHEMTAWRGDVRTHAVWQAVQLVSAAGFRPDLGDINRTGEGGPFAYARGLADSQETAGCKLEADEVRALRALVLEESRCPDLVVSGALFEALCGYFRWQLDTDFRSLRVIREMYGSRKGRAT